MIVPWIPIFSKNNIYIPKAENTMSYFVCFSLRFPLNLLGIEVVQERNSICNRYTH